MLAMSCVHQCGSVCVSKWQGESRVLTVFGETLWCKQIGLAMMSCTLVSDQGGQYVFHLSQDTMTAAMAQCDTILV